LMSGGLLLEEVWPIC